MRRREEPRRARSIWSASAFSRMAWMAASGIGEPPEAALVGLRVRLALEHGAVDRTGGVLGAVGRDGLVRALGHWRSAAELICRALRLSDGPGVLAEATVDQQDRIVIGRSGEGLDNLPASFGRGFGPLLRFLGSDRRDVAGAEHVGGLEMGGG